MSSTLKQSSNSKQSNKQSLGSKYQSVEGIRVYKTRKYVQSDKTKQNAENRRLRDQYLIDHKDEIMKINHRNRNKEVQKMIKHDLDLDFNYNTLYSALKKYELI